MSEPASYELLQALKARLQLISQANGYRTDIGADVRIDGSEITFDGAPVVQVVMGRIERLSDEKKSTPRYRSSAADIGVQATVPCTAATAQLVGHRARADLLRALFDTAVDLPKQDDGMATSIVVRSEEILNRADGANAIVVQITASAGLTERINPTQ